MYIVYAAAASRVDWTEDELRRDLRSHSDGETVARTAEAEEQS